MLVVLEQLDAELDRGEPAAAERDLGPPVVAPHEALPEALGRREPVGMPGEHLAEPRAADLLGALADPEDRDRGLPAVRVEPVVERLQSRGDVRLVVARPTGVHGAVAQVRPEGIAVPGREVARRLDVVVRVDNDPPRPAADELGEDGRHALGRPFDHDAVEASPDALLDPCGHALDRLAVAADRRDPAGLAPLVDEAVGLASDRASSLGGKRVGIRGQHLGPVVGHEDEVLEPDAAVALPVAAWLDGDDVARDERAAREVERGVLVDVEPDAVAERRGRTRRAAPRRASSRAAWDSRPPRPPREAIVCSSRPVTPGRIAGITRSCTSRQRRW